MAAQAVRVPHSRSERLRSAPLAQLDRALDYGSKGWGFDSSRVRHFSRRQGRVVHMEPRVGGSTPPGCATSAGACARVGGSTPPGCATSAGSPHGTKGWGFDSSRVRHFSRRQGRVVHMEPRVGGSTPPGCATSAVGRDASSTWNQGLGVRLLQGAPLQPSAGTRRPHGTKGWGFDSSRVRHFSRRQGPRTKGWGSTPPGCATSAVQGRVVHMEPRVGGSTPPGCAIFLLPHRECRPGPPCRGST